MHHKSPFRPHVFQNVGKHFRKLRVIDTQKLSGGSCRIGQGPQHVENCADAYFTARADSVFHRAVQFWREKKADADLLHAFFHHILVGADVYT